MSSLRILSIVVLLAPLADLEVKITMSPSDTLSAVEELAKGIPRTFPLFTNFDMIYNSNSKLTPALLMARSQAQDLSRVSYDFLKSSLAANLVIDLSETANSKPESIIQLYHENQYNFKYNQPHSLVLFEADSETRARSDLSGNSSDYGRRWPEKVLPLLPNPVQRSFVFFCLLEADEEIELVVALLMRKVGMFQHFVFLVPARLGGVSVLRGLPQEPETKLRQIARYDTTHQTLQIEGTIFVRWLPDLNGAAVVSVFCFSFEPDDRQFAKTGIETSPVEVPWRVIHRILNATAEVETLFLSPGNGMTGDDEFDEYATQILDGLAAIVGQIVPYHKTQHLIEFTPPYFFDAVGFITGPEKIRISGSISVLGEPFGLYVWAIFGFTCFSIVLALELVIAFALPKWSFQVHNGVWIAIFGPMVSQIGRLGYKVEQLSLKLLLGTWLLSLIVIQCEYLCIMTSEIVIPTKIYPPSTFAELARSDYGIGAIFWDIIEPHITESQDPVNQEIAWRALPHDFLEPKCYQMIFEERKVCLGYQGIFQFTGAGYLTDIRGRRMGRLSTETRFFTMTVAGISKFYPFLLEPFTTYISRVESFGLSRYTAQHALSLARMQGKHYAEDWVRVKKYYRGSESSVDAEEDDRIISVVVQILMGGFVLAFFTLLLEVLSKILTWCIEIKTLVSKNVAKSRKSKVMKLGV